MGLIRRSEAPFIVVKRGRVVDSTPPQGSAWPEFPDGLPDGEYVPVEQLRGAVEALDALEKAGRRALAQWQDPHGEDFYHQHAFEMALNEARGR